MSRTLDVLAPAPIRHVPPRSREARTSYAPVYERVAIRDLSRADAPEGPEMPVNGGGLLATRLVDGAAWRPIGGDNAFGVVVHKGTRLAAREFLDWLEGRGDGLHLDRNDEFNRCLEGTPLLARIPGQRDPHRPYAPWDGVRQGALRLDGREGAIRRVRDFVEREVALIDGVPFVRLIGPIAFVVAGNAVYQDGRYREKPLAMRLLRHPGGWTSNAAVSLCDLYRHDRPGDVLAPDGLPPVAFKRSWRPVDLAGLWIRPDDDIDLMLRESLRILVAMEPSRGYPFGRERNEALQALSALASVGGIERDDAQGAWTFVRWFCDAIAEHREPPGEERGTLGYVIAEARRIRAYADRVALPRIRERPVVPTEDDGDLAAFAPA